MDVRRARSGCPREKTTVPDRRAAVGRRLSAGAGRRLSAAGARCGRLARGCAHWVSRRRRIAADQFLRGLCYGAGTAVVGLLVVWAQAR
ncbi:hypothetical protein [Streptomyces roseolilacinus]|uniref:Uncharacterized protein n=1 Tax=Streptomyces roseolilacinus TaxID=66904 RepID=A0A918B1X9_9ACTN|nr:hypothetical protein [Streptomyces roseolilacinus]GGQ13329.1 hypothetical protein GCM10010249_35130 [Streptomyces roseolilacinus]